MSPLAPLPRVALVEEGEGEGKKEGEKEKEVG